MVGTAIYWHELHPYTRNIVCDKWLREWEIAFDQHNLLCHRGARGAILGDV